MGFRAGSNLAGGSQRKSTRPRTRRATMRVRILIPTFVAVQLGLGSTCWAPAPPERISPDTPKTTLAGNTFVAPAGWSIVVRGPATVLEVPEGGSFIALVDVPVKDAATADAAVAAAWAAYKTEAKWPLKVTTPIADKDGWTQRRSYEYQTSPNEKRDVGADVRRANDVWTVSIYDMAQDVGEKRGAQVGLIYGKLLPKGRSRETFAGKQAHELDAARLAELRKFI